MHDVAAVARNALLEHLDEPTLARWLPHLHEVPLELGDVLHEAGQAVGEVYFLLAGMVSLVVDLDGGQSVEVVTIGREGMVGIPVLLHAERACERAVVQVKGAALRMGAEDFQHQLGTADAGVHAAFSRYTHAVFSHLARNSACNRVHSIPQRAARWLLLIADRVDGPTFELTQDYLATMLAVRRASISHVARSLAEQGCITYVRGRITITDREKLRSNACGCYDVNRDSVLSALQLQA
ncbi:Crp/Fnr family transcriptional regulator [Kineococcus sp. SYSU DK005]|uniref:Crp/Fnr family transcriptional regulator n=1 Tax=Kineococcus sp. SYSU DK005 TaxID=3383126 RepID=UPI003D7D96D3